MDRHDGEMRFHSSRWPVYAVRSEFSSGRFCDYAIIDFKLHNFQKLPNKKWTGFESAAHAHSSTTDARVMQVLSEDNQLEIYVCLTEALDKAVPRQLGHVHAWSSWVISLLHSKRQVSPFLSH